MLLHQKTNLFILITTVFATVLVYAVCSKVIGDLLLNASEREKLAITDNILKDTAVLDELLLNIEKQWDDELAISLPKIANQLESSLFLNNKDGSVITQEAALAKLNQLKQIYNVSDIHLIDRELKIFASTFETELGLDLSKFSEAYTAYLNNLFGKSEFAAHRLSLSDTNGRLKKYAYYSLANSDILVNVDIDVKSRLDTEKDNRLGTYIFGEYVQKLASKYHVIDDIDLLIISETNQWSLLNQGRFVEPSLARQIYNGTFVSDVNALSTFIPASLASYETIGFKSVLHITYNNTMSEGLQTQLRYVLFGIAIFIIIISYVTLKVGTKVVFLNRFNSLNHQIKQKMLGDKKEISLSGDDELSMIANEVNGLMRRMERQIELNKGLYTKSTTDSLTAIANRRYFDEQLSIEWRQAKRLKNDFSIIMLDIDFFKEYNDEYGHVAGDDCLKQVAKFIDSELTRPRDFVARYGGEEFMCLLPETDPQGAQTIAHQLRQKIQALNIEHSTSKIANSITVSIGCLTINGASDIDESALITEVDTLLYLSKTTGKNKVSIDYIAK